MLAFTADGRNRPVAGVDLKFIIKRKNIPSNRIEKLFVVAAGKVRAADRVFEQAVADEDDLFGEFGEYDVAARVAGTMPHGKTQFADLEDLAVAPIACDLWRCLVIKAERCKLFGRNAHKQGLLLKSVIQFLVIGVNDDLGIWERRVKSTSAADVIEMPVRKRYCGERETVFAEKSFELDTSLAGIDDDRLLRFFANGHARILLKRSLRKGLNSHCNFVMLA